MNAFPAIAALIPHRGPNQLIDAVDACDAESVRTHALVRADAWFAEEDGAMPGWLGLELMAQTIAAFVGLEKHRHGGSPAPGYLLGTNAYTCRLPAFAAGTRLDIEARLVFRETNGLGAFDCAIELAGQRVAEATLKVYEET